MPDENDDVTKRGSVSFFYFSGQLLNGVRARDKRTDRGSGFGCFLQEIKRCGFESRHRMHETERKRKKRRRRWRMEEASTSAILLLMVTMATECFQKGRIRQNFNLIEERVKKNQWVFKFY